MAQSPASIHLGFMTILQDGNSYSGGYLITNSWGRPVEFRVTSAVQPSRVLQVLYASTLAGYVCGEVIGRALVEKSATSVQLLLTDCEAALELRQQKQIPSAWLPSATTSEQHSHYASERLVRVPQLSEQILFTHPLFCSDTTLVLELLQQLDRGFDLQEPFQRIREAMTEARRLQPPRLASAA